MSTASFSSKIFPDRWIGCDTYCLVSADGGPVTFVLSLPELSPRANPKRIVLTDGQSVQNATLLRGQQIRLPVELPLEGETLLRILISNPEPATDEQNDLLGVQVLDVCVGDTDVSILSEDPVSQKIPPLTFPGYRAIRPEFDSEFYLRQIEGPKPVHDLVTHYLAFGWRQNLRPTPKFDLEFYVAQMRDSQLTLDQAPLLHYLAKGRLLGLSRTREAAEARSEAKHEAFQDEIWVQRLRDVLSALGLDAEYLSDTTFSRYVLKMFDPIAYRERNHLSHRLNESELLVRYLTFDFPQGIAPGPLFDEAHYLAGLRDFGIRPTQDETPFQHWLRQGIELRISPTPLFEPSEYLSKNKDLVNFPHWLFEHWIMHGLFEGRLFDRNLRLAPSRSWVGENDGVQLSAMHGLALKVTRTPGMLDEVVSARRFRDSNTFSKLMQEANDVDPNVGMVNDQTLALIPPFFDENFAHLIKILDKLPQDGCNSVVLMPFCKLGGADFVAGVLSGALDEVGQRTVVLRTEQSDWERPDWFSDSVVCVDISKELDAFPDNIRPRALYEVVRYLKAEAIFNVNSRRAFEMFESFGARLKLFSRLYCYYFCADRTPDGAETGYPIWYFASLLPHLDGALVDTEFLADTLITRHSLDPHYAKKVKVLYTPAMNDPLPEPLALSQVPARGTRERPIVLWAGRFDRQKRFDLLVEIASIMPKVDFRCWGKAVLDAPPDVSELPENMTLEGSFSSYDELPLGECEGWLYTSAWDGMPTILIELAAMGMPITASAVGGVPEMIDETTGWPLDENATAADYANALREMVNTPSKREQCGTALRERAVTRHTEEQYRKALIEMLNEERSDV